MKRIILAILAVALFSVTNLSAQTIKAIPYQTVVRDAQGNPMPNQEVTVRFYIQRTISSRSDADPLLLYSETQTTESDANGLVSLQVGEGTPLEGSFDAVDWWGKVSIKVELMPSRPRKPCCSNRTTVPNGASNATTTVT